MEMRIESVFSLASAVETDIDDGCGQERQRSETPDSVVPFTDEASHINTVATHDTADVTTVAMTDTDDVTTVAMTDTDDVTTIAMTDTDDVTTIAMTNDVTAVATNFTEDVTTIAKHNSDDNTKTRSVPTVPNIDTTSDGIDSMPPMHGSYNTPIHTPSSREGTLSCHSNNWLSPEKATLDRPLLVVAPDAPPDLQLVYDIDDSMEYNYTLDSIAPPTLMPEIIGVPSKEVGKHKPNEEEASTHKYVDKRNANPKILPSYIVLTDIMTEIERISKSGSCSVNKLDFKECSNMCKKMNFRKRLDAGKDVFNVKVPSKQKAYEVYMKEMNSPTSDVTKLMKITNDKYKKTKKQRKRGSKKRYMSRVNRKIISIPTDFKMDSAIDVRKHVEVEEKIDHIPADVVEKELVRRKFKLELKTLKELIMVKREANKRLHRIKKAKVYNNVKDPLIKVAGSKSFSGRIRKSNVRLCDFATNRFDEDTCVIQRNTMARLNSMKRKRPSTQDMRDHIVKKLRVGNPPPPSPSPPPPPPPPLLSVEKSDSNVESVEAESKSSPSPFMKFKVKGDHLIEMEPPLYSKVTIVPETETRRVRRNPRKLKKKNTGKVTRPTMPKGKRDELIEATECSINEVRQKSQPKSTKDASMQNMPVDNNLVDGQQKSLSTFGKKRKPRSLVSKQNVPVDNNLVEGQLQMSPSWEKSNAASASTVKSFPVAVSLLSRRESSMLSLVNAAPVQFGQKNKSKEYKVEIQAAQFSSEQAMLSEKYKALKIPENVQRLFNKTTYTNVILSNSSLTTNSSTSGITQTTSSLPNSSKTSVSSGIPFVKKRLAPKQEEQMKITIPIKNLYTGASQEPMKLYIPQKDLLALTKSLGTPKTTTFQPQCSVPQLSALDQRNDTTVAHLLDRKRGVHLPNYRALRSKSPEPLKSSHTPTSSHTPNTLRKQPVVVCVPKVTNITTAESLQTAASCTYTKMPIVLQTVASCANTKMPISLQTAGSCTDAIRPINLQSVAAITATTSSAGADNSPLPTSAPITMQTKVVTVYPPVSTATGKTFPKTTTTTCVTKPALQIPVSTPLTAAKKGPQETQKGKFYLLKVDGTNFLIPIDSNSVSPLMVRKSQPSTSTTATPISIRPATGIPATVSPSTLSPTIVSQFGASIASNPTVKGITAASSIRHITPVSDWKKPTLTPAIQSSNTKPMVSPLSNSEKPYPIKTVYKIDTPPVNQNIGSANTSLIPTLPITRIKTEVEDPEYAKAEGEDSNGNQNVYQRDTERSESELTRKNKRNSESTRGYGEPESARETMQERNMSASPNEESTSLSPKKDGQSEDNVKAPNEKLQAFVDSMTTREERLRRLKEKLKQNQKAVEELRGSILKH